ncbi:hypothetical protein [Nocardia sp. NPDC057440]|uniref:hypothetical protein n=1 Tax=Nocardia sp. NPDC057440 TaxID=3346134 RepID=UPI00366DD240
MKTAPLQGDPLQYVDDGVAGKCARDLALTQLASAARVDAASMTRAVIYHASAAAITGRCEPIVSYTVAAGDTGGSTVGGRGQQPCTDRRSSPSEIVGAAVIVLPNTAAAQGVCGKRVDQGAISTGDLIFWDYGDYRRTQVGIAVEATQLVTADPVSGDVVQREIPKTSDVRVKRVLESAR